VIEDQGPSLPTPAEKIDPPTPKADTSADQLPMWPKALGLLPIVRG
jgi:anti-sigma regulatory factor (Ser/Thr protein kinase)